MRDCFHLDGRTCTEVNGLKAAAITGHDAQCRNPHVCDRYVPSVPAPLDDVVPPRGEPDARAVDDLGGESRGVVDVLPDDDVPQRYTPPSCPDGGPKLRPLVFGVAGPNTGGAVVPMHALVCGGALDGECASPCYFGMYSLDIGAAHAAVPAAGKILRPGVRKM